MKNHQIMNFEGVSEIPRWTAAGEAKRELARQALPKASLTSPSPQAPLTLRSIIDRRVATRRALHGLEMPPTDL